MSPVESVKPANNEMPCKGEHYRGDATAVILEQAPLCIWCLRFARYPNNGPCPGLLDPEKAREYCATLAGDA